MMPSERGARMARREERAYWAYVSDEQRCQPGCPARELGGRGGGVPVLALLLLQGSRGRTTWFGTADMSFALWSILQPRITRYTEDSSDAGRSRPVASKGRAAEGTSATPSATTRRYQVRSLGLRARPDQCRDFGFEGLAAGESSGGDQPGGIDGPVPARQRPSCIGAVISAECFGDRLVGRVGKPTAQRLPHHCDTDRTDRAQAAASPPVRRFWGRESSLHSIGGQRQTLPVLGATD